MTELPYLLQHAVDQCRNDFGHVVDIVQKSKTLRKFGRNSSLGTSIETIEDQGGNETYLTANSIDVVVSDSASDTGTVKIEGHTIDGSGNLTFAVQTATLNGTTNVTLATPLARATRLINTSAADLVGVVKVVQASAPSVIYVQAEAPVNGSEKAATSISQTDYWFLDQLYGSVEGNGSATVDFSLEIREQGGVFREQISFGATESGRLITLTQPIIVRPNSDVRMRGIASTNNIQAVAYMSGYLATIDRVV